VLILLWRVEGFGGKGKLVLLFCWYVIGNEYIEYRDLSVIEPLIIEISFLLRLQDEVDSMLKSLRLFENSAYWDKFS
jgi:hypothetical protein